MRCATGASRRPRGNGPRSALLAIGVFVAMAMSAARGGAVGPGEYKVGYNDAFSPLPAESL